MILLQSKEQQQCGYCIITRINNIDDICLPSLGITMVSVISVTYDQ